MNSGCNDELGRERGRERREEREEKIEWKKGRNNMCLMNKRISRLKGWEQPIKEEASISCIDTMK